MSNSSGLNNQLVQGFGGSFFHWVSNEVLPYVLGSVLGLCVLVGIILNIILLVVYVKRQLYKDPTSDFIPQIAIVDLVASFVVVIPSSVAALLHKWPLSDTLCDVHGVLVIWFHLLSFALVIMIFVERVTKAWNPKLHGSTFNTHTFVIIISCIVWAADLLVGLMPILGIGTIGFNKYQSQCSVVHKDHVMLTHIIFSLGLYCSPVICLICFILLIDKRRRNILHERSEERNKLIDFNEEAAEGTSGEAGGKDIPLSPTKTADDKGSESAADVVKKGPSKAWGKDTEKGKAGHFKKNANGRAAAKDKAKGPCEKKKLSREEFLERYNRRMSRPKSQTLMSRMFRDTEDEKDHHQAMTALITWSILEICWVWYLVAAMLEIYSGADVWGGWHIIGVLMGDLTYCIKPIVYLAHNRHYRKVSKETMPDVVRETADAVARKLGQAVDKVDNMLFHSPGAQKSKTTKLQAAVAVQTVAMRWKRKAAIGISKFGVDKKPNAVTDKPENQAGNTAPASTNIASGSKPSGSLMGSSIAAVAMAQAEAKKKEEAAAPKKEAPVPDLLLPPPNSPPSMSKPSTRQGTPGSVLSSRPATKSSVLLSMQSQEGASQSTSPHPPSTAATLAQSGDDDLAQLMNPHSPHP